MGMNGKKLDVGEKSYRNAESQATNALRKLLPGIGGVGSPLRLSPYSTNRLHCPRSR
jgi:hypothetical protein